MRYENCQLLFWNGGSSSALQTWRHNYIEAPFPTGLGKHMLWVICEGSPGYVSSEGRARSSQGCPTSANDEVCYHLSFL